MTNLIIGRLNGQYNRFTNSKMYKCFRDDEPNKLKEDCLFVSFNIAEIMERQPLKENTAVLTSGDAVPLDLITKCLSRSRP